MSKPTSSRALLRRNDERFIRLAHTFTEDEWNSPSLCVGWSNLDVLAHLVVGCSASLSSVGVGVARHGGSFDRANTAMTKSLSEKHSAPELLERYQRVSQQRSGIGRLFPKNLLLGDHVLHELDIVIALGRTPTVEAEVIAAVLQTEVSIPNPFVPAKRTADGLNIAASDVEWSHAATTVAPHVAGPGWALALVLANRPKALTHLQGHGATVLAERLSGNGHAVPGTTDGRW